MLRHAFARQFPRRYGDALFYRSVLPPSIGSTTRLDLFFDAVESHFPAAYHSPSLRLNIDFVARLMVRAPTHGQGLSIEFCEFGDTRQCLQLPRQSSDGESLHRVSRPMPFRELTTNFRRRQLRHVRLSLIEGREFESWGL